MKRSVLLLVECPECADVRVPAGEVTLRNCLDDDDWSYRFVCPSCHMRATAPAVPSLAMDAIFAGARFESWRYPAELNEHHCSGPPIGSVDLVALQLFLIEPDWIDVLKRTRTAG